MNDIIEQMRAARRPMGRVQPASSALLLTLALIREYKEEREAERKKAMVKSYFIRKDFAIRRKLREARHQPAHGYDDFE